MREALVPTISAAQITEPVPSLSFSDERQVDVDHLNTIAVEKGLDHSQTLQLLRGYGFYQVLKDSEVFRTKDGFNAEEASGIKQNLLEHMQWQEDYKHLPPRLRGKIRIAKRMLSAVDFTDPQGFARGQEIWKNRVRDETRYMLDGNILVNNSLELYNEIQNP